MHRKERAPRLRLLAVGGRNSRFGKLQLATVGCSKLHLLHEQSFSTSMGENSTVKVFDIRVDSFDELNHVQFHALLRHFAQSFPNLEMLKIRVDDSRVFVFTESDVDDRQNMVGCIIATGSMAGYFRKKNLGSATHCSANTRASFMEWRQRRSRCLCRSERPSTAIWSASQNTT